MVRLSFSEQNTRMRHAIGKVSNPDKNDMLCVVNSL